MLFNLQIFQCVFSKKQDTFKIIIVNHQRWKININAILFIGSSDFTQISQIDLIMFFLVKEKQRFSGPGSHVALGYHISLIFIYLEQSSVFLLLQGFVFEEYRLCMKQNWKICLCMSSCWLCIDVLCILLSVASGGVLSLSFFKKIIIPSSLLEIRIKEVKWKPCFWEAAMLRHGGFAGLFTSSCIVVMVIAVSQLPYKLLHAPGLQADITSNCAWSLSLHSPATTWFPYYTPCFYHSYSDSHLMITLRLIQLYSYLSLPSWLWGFWRVCHTRRHMALACPITSRISFYFICRDFKEILYI